MTSQAQSLTQRQSRVRVEASDFLGPHAGATRRSRLTQARMDWIAQIWDAAMQGRDVDGVALAAVGSLGRADLGPCSDLDLVLLHEGRRRERGFIADLAERLWYPIWDAGVRLDHSVRTVGDCREAAAGDLPAAIGLLDLRRVAGDATLVEAARATVGHDWRSGARTRLPALTDHLAARHRRHGEIAPSLRPDLKEAHGGLRDVAVIRALTQSWLADRPHGDGLNDAASTLLDVRDAIHVVTGRGRDVLQQEDQDSVAALTGHGDRDALLINVARAGRVIAYALDSTMRRAGQAQRARTLSPRARRPQMRALGYGFFEHDGEVVLGSTTTLDADPVLPLRAAVVAARARLPIAPTTLRNLAEQCPDLPQPFPGSARALLADLLATGPGLVVVWEGLHQHGLIERWLPEWAAVVSRPQRNAVHRHTVDRHLIETAVSASRLVRRVARPDLLVMAALLHDIGKGWPGSDHSVAGAPIAERIMLRCGYDEADTEVVGLLVREHLTAIDLATTRDLDDPGTITAAVEAVGGDHETWELLLALTEADARAVGDTAWTSWRASLLGQLGSLVGERITSSASVNASATAHDADEVDDADNRDGPALDHANRPDVDVTAVGDGFRIVVIDHDRPGLFADTAALLAGEGFVVRSALLRTKAGAAIDEWQVAAPGGSTPEADRLARRLARLREGDRGPLDALVRRRQFVSPLPADADHPPARAFLVPGVSADATVIEVRAHDRYALLSDLGHALAERGVSVRSAHIETYAGQARDTFYLTDHEGQVLTPAVVASVVAALIDSCSSAG